MNINILESITTTVGMNKADSLDMSNIETVGDTSMMIAGRLTEIIDGDVHSETKKERNEVSEGKIITQSTGTNEQHSDKMVKNNSAEQSNNF